MWASLIAPGHDRSEKPEFTSLLRSDTLMSHQSDPRHRSNFIRPRARNDNIDLVNLAARISLGRCDRSSLRSCTTLLRSLPPTRESTTTQHAPVRHVDILNNLICQELTAHRSNTFTPCTMMRQPEWARSTCVSNCMLATDRSDREFRIEYQSPGRGGRLDGAPKGVSDQRIGRHRPTPRNQIPKYRLPSGVE